MWNLWNCVTFAIIHNYLCIIRNPFSRWDINQMCLCLPYSFTFWSKIGLHFMVFLCICVHSSNIDTLAALSDTLISLNTTPSRYYFFFKNNKKANNNRQKKTLSVWHRHPKTPALYHLIMSLFPLQCWKRQARAGRGRRRLSGQSHPRG